ncbi:MAG: hypothetical protein HY821_17090, partial [Acidobacteria bacterium]|nr:hypothetical protein [Acidobacteriota bacterium]
MDTWQGAKFNHAASTRFALDGAHARADCRRCHVGGRFAGTPTDCFSCHSPLFTAAQNPNHVQAGFPRDCAACHGTLQWAGAVFDHAARTAFALTGAHGKAQCASCHVAGRFAGTPQNCDSCHIEAYNLVKNPDHAASNFPRDCSQCHSTSQWKGASFDHSRSRFALTGAHLRTECAQCHTGGRYTGTPAACEGCHLSLYQSASNPNHTAAGFPKECATCHTTAQWSGASFNHDTATKFALTGAHSRPQCSQCHAGGRFAGTPQNCDGCHLEVFQSAANPNHVAAGFSRDCSTCHTTVQWKGGTFDHAAKTRFPLTGAHQQVQCNACHVAGRYAGTLQQCEGCHLEKFQRTTNPNHVTSGFPRDCAICHNTRQWLGAVFDHTSMTKFPLAGKHTAAACSLCHANGLFAGTPAVCEGCHLAQFNQAKNPNHLAAGFPKDCSICHTPQQWAGAKYDHATLTRFPLTGKHSAATCAQCHGNGVYRGTPAACDGCHLAQFNQTTNPNHVAAGLPKDCSTCHTTQQWAGAKFDHSSMTKFPLTGKHVAAACSQCHVNGVFRGTPAACDGCHLENYVRTTNPNHASAGFPKDCAVCHTTQAWTGAKFDHGTMTKFPLTGRHTNTSCSQCHQGGLFRGTPTACERCHLSNYNQSQNPNHVAAGFPKDCAICHTTAQWAGAVFDHGKTRFALTGAHRNTNCNSCHASGVYAGTPSACENCHLAKYNQTKSPNHASAGFSKDCALCHTTQQWTGAKFDHTTTTRFPLTGKHTAVACTQCHVNGVYRGTATACEGCHLPKYNQTTNPNHAAAGFPKDCAMCHTTQQWPGAKFDHSTMTRFPLTGKHTATSCTQCHANGVYRGTQATCDGCHLTKYNQTTNPNHAAAGFPKDCALCHTTQQWSGARFDHSAATRFPLSGKHTTTACSQCHLNGVYRGTPAACEGCHLAKYNQTSNPNHAAAGFSKDCALCHTTQQWPGAKFDHSTMTRFPLTGKHVGTSCTQCHTNGVYRGTPSSCDGCHLAKYNQTSNPNHAAAGFPRDCAMCHTTQQWNGAKFDHS